MTRLVFLDTETTGLDPDRHEIWEVAYIIRDEGVADQERSVQLPIYHGERADPYGLRVGGWFDRRISASMFKSTELSPNYPDDVVLAANGGIETVYEFARRIVREFNGATIVGAVPDFDVRFLTRWLNAHGQPWTGHYHLCDVENLAVGFLASELADARRTSTVTTYDPNVIVPPWSSDALAKELGVTIEESARHTALGDARWARDMYDAVMGFA